MTAPFYPTGALGEEAALIAVFLVGLSFGFFLERAGFGSARKLTAIFYFRDYAVLRVMFTAVVVAMLGLLYLASLGWIEMEGVSIPPTFLGAQIVGGLLLGLGFVVGGYCPGTSVVGAASGKLDALAYMLGLVFGVTVFALGFEPLKSLYYLGSMGVVTLSDWSGLSLAALGLFVVLMALGAFAASEWHDRSKARRLSTSESAADASRRGVHVLLTWQRAGAVLAVLLGVIILTSHSVAGNRPETLAKAAGTGEALIQPRDLAGLLTQKARLEVVDLRDAAAFSQYHIPGAKNVSILELAHAQLPKHLPVILCSDDGALAGQAWAVLASRGVDARVLEGGMRQWIEVAGPPELRASGAQLPANAAGLRSVPTPASSAAMAAAPPAMGKVKRFKKGSSCS